MPDRTQIHQKGRLSCTMGCKANKAIGAAELNGWLLCRLKNKKVPHLSVRGAAIVRCRRHHWAVPTPGGSMSADTYRQLFCVADGLTDRRAEVLIAPRSSEVVMHGLVGPSWRRCSVCGAAAMAPGNHNATQLRRLSDAAIRSSDVSWVCVISAVGFRSQCSGCISTATSCHQVCVVCR